MSIKAWRSTLAVTAVVLAVWVLVGCAVTVFVQWVI